MPVVTVNHVLSSHFFTSGIFADLCRRFADGASGDIRITISPYRLPGQDIYHFHRPHRECRLPPNAVATVHHDPEDPDPWQALELFLPRYREARQVVCLNRRQYALLGALGLTNLTLIPHGADKEALGRKEATAPSLSPPFRLGFFSRRFTRAVKGEDRLAALLGHLDPAAFAFVFVGAGRWQDAAAARRFGFRCVAYEAPPYRLFGALYREIDALLILSRHEGGPASLPEALATGTPVLATPVGMAPDLIRDGENGLLLSGEPRADAARLAALMGDGGAAFARLRAGALATAVLDWREVLERHYALYRALAAEARRAA